MEAMPVQLRNYHLRRLKRKLLLVSKCFSLRRIQSNAGFPHTWDDFSPGTSFPCIKSEIQTKSLITSFTTSVTAQMSLAQRCLQLPPYFKLQILCVAKVHVPLMFQHSYLSFAMYSLSICINGSFVFQINYFALLL